MGVHLQHFPVNYAQQNFFSAPGYAYYLYICVHLVIVELNRKTTREISVTSMGIPMKILTDCVTRTISNFVIFNLYLFILLN